MSSVRSWREFIRQRLTAAGEDTFAAFQNKIVECEQQINRQRRILDVVLKPDVRLHRIDLLQQHENKEEVVLADQQLTNQDSSLDQNEPQPPQIKEEPGDLCTSQDGPQLPTTSGESVKHNVFRKTVQNKYQRRKHHRIHTELQQYLCKLCGTGLSSKSGLQIHMRIHTGEKPYSCKTCGKSFSKRTNFVLHMRIHTGEKPYRCKTCGKRVTDPSAFKRHLSTHTDEKPHSCEICGKRFRHTNTLLCHVRYHTGERPYPCDLCGNSFVSASKLQRHVKTHK